MFNHDNAAELGRKGGKTTVARHGSEHMARIGKAGFLGLARKLGFARGYRSAAVRRLQQMGRLRVPAHVARHSDLTMAEYHRLCRELGLDD